MSGGFRLGPGTSGRFANLRSMPPPGPHSIGPRRVRAVALAPSELVRVAETGRERGLASDRPGF